MQTFWQRSALYPDSPVQLTTAPLNPAEKASSDGEQSVNLPAMRILLVDDHVVVLQSLKTLLNQLAPQLSIDVAETADEAVRMAAENNYELVLLDWHLGTSSGDACIRRLHEAGCTARVVVLSGETDPQLIRGTIESGAAGFISKKASSSVMLAALGVVINGGVYLAPEVLRDMSAARAGSPAERGLLAGNDRFAGLSKRQVEVYLAAARGLPNKLIARHLGIAESTVKTHLSAVFHALGVKNRTEAAYQASRDGIKVG